MLDPRSRYANLSAESREFLRRIKTRDQIMPAMDLGDADPESCSQVQDKSDIFNFDLEFPESPVRPIPIAPLLLDHQGRKMLTDSPRSHRKLPRPGSYCSPGDPSDFSSHLEFTAINRSQSFHGRPTTPISPLSPGCSLTLSGVLGEGFRNTNSKMNSLKRGSPPASTKTSFNRKSIKTPKVPRPARTMLMFDCVKKGIRDCIQATESDISLMKHSEDYTTLSSTGQARILDIGKHMKAAERHKKRLEFHLAKIEALEEQYTLHQQLREGAKNMAKAYSVMSTAHKKESMHNVECGFRECTRVLCSMEAQLEILMGTFHCQMKGLAGFARLMPGDVYEVTLRHGEQKWKSRGRIGSNAQQWDAEEFVFKALIGDIINVKVVELKGLGKHLQLGEKNCETKGLFSSHPQLMTVSINTNGSVKLTTVVTWNPLEGVEEGVVASGYELITSVTPVRRRLPTSPNGDTSNFLKGQRESISSDYSSDHSPHSTPSLTNHHRYSAPVFPSLEDLSDAALSSSPSPSPTTSTNNISSTRSASRPNSIAVMDTISENLTLGSLTTLDTNDNSTKLVTSSAEMAKITRPKLIDMSLLSASLEAHVSQGDVLVRFGEGMEAISLEEAVHSLRTSLEDYQGQYVELQNLEEQVSILDTRLRESAGGHTARISNASVENALEAFDFLDHEDCLFEDNLLIEGPGGSSQSSSLDALEAKCTLSPESTTKTADSGIESIANRLSEDHGIESGIGSVTTDLPSTGNDQVDVALLWHVKYSDKLLENLGRFGPLKCKEIYSLDKLQRQAVIIDQLLKICEAGGHVGDLQQVMSEVTQAKDLKLFWVRCVDETVLYTTTSRCSAQLEKTYGELIQQKYDAPVAKVIQTLLARILDEPKMELVLSENRPITLHQFLEFFTNEEKFVGLQEYVEKLAQEVWMSGRLRSGDTDITIKTLLVYENQMVAPSGLRIISLLLLVDSLEVRQAAARFLKHLSVDSSLRDEMLVVYVEALEEESPDVRCAACTALKLLQAVESMEQLVFVSQSDNSRVVKHRARDAVLSFGEEGQRALSQSELTANGFQGVSVQL